MKCFAGNVIVVKAADVAAEDILAMSASSFLDLSKKHQTLLIDRLSKQTFRASLFWKPELSLPGSPDLGRVEMLSVCQ